MRDTNIFIQPIKATLVNMKVDSALETNTLRNGKCLVRCLSSSFTTSTTLTLLACASSRTWCVFGPVFVSIIVNNFQCVCLVQLSSYWSVPNLNLWPTVKVWKHPLDGNVIPFRNEADGTAEH